MTLAQWTESSVDYGRELVDSAVKGARAAEVEFVRTEPLSPFFEENARHALAPALVGACLGALGGFFARGQHSRTRAARDSQALPPDRIGADAGRSRSGDG